MMLASDFIPTTPSLLPPDNKMATTRRLKPSLTDKDFYPLIHICTKVMTYDEKVAYRVKQGFPTTIDMWIADEKTRTEAPSTSPHKRGPPPEYMLSLDDVECVLNVIRKEVSI